jgi:plastocyanin
VQLVRNGLETRRCFPSVTQLIQEVYMPVAVRRAAALAAVSGTVVAPAAAVGVTAHASSVHVIVLKHMAFSPRAITVHKSDSVEFIWEDGSIPHNVTGSAFHSSTKTKGTYTVKFTRKGTYAFRCTIHAGMTGTVTVK